MNNITIRIENINTEASENYKEIQIYIDGNDLKNIVREIEAPFAVKEGHPKIAGNYIGLDARYITKNHFLGVRDKAYEGNLIVKPSSKIALLDCPCGCLGCWTLEANIIINDALVIWDYFEQIHRNGDIVKDQIWGYGNLSFKFNKNQYIEELEKIKT